MNWSIRLNVSENIILNSLRTITFLVVEKFRPNYTRANSPVKWCLWRRRKRSEYFRYLSHRWNGNKLFSPGLGSARQTFEGWILWKLDITKCSSKIYTVELRIRAEYYWESELSLKGQRMTFFESSMTFCPQSKFDCKSSHIIAQEKKVRPPKPTRAESESLRAYARGELRARRPLTDVIPVVNSNKEFIFYFNQTVQTKWPSTSHKRRSRPLRCNLYPQLTKLKRQLFYS